MSGTYPVLPRRPDMGRIGAEAAALYELLNPGTILQTGIGGDPEKQRALQDFIAAAGGAYAQGRLRLQEGDLAEGWVEVFPELTDDERRLGELPGFTPERIEQWLETYPAEDLGLPDHTGAPVPADPSGNIISTPIPQELGPNIVEARPGETFTTPGGNAVGERAGTPWENMEVRATGWNTSQEKGILPSRSMTLSPIPDRISAVSFLAAVDTGVKK